MQPFNHDNKPTEKKEEENLFLLMNKITNQTE